MHHSLLRWLMWFLPLSVLDILFYSHHKGFKGVRQCQNMCNTAVWDTKYIGIIFIFPFYHQPTLPPLMYSILLALPIEMQDGYSTVGLYVIAWCVCSKLCPVLTSRTRGCFHSCISCVSSLRCQDWRVREKEPPTEEEWDWSVARQPQLGAAIQLTFPSPRPYEPSAVHPLSTLPVFISGHALITEFPGNCPNRLPCVAMCAACCVLDTNRDYAIRWVSGAAALSACKQGKESPHLCHWVVEQTTARYLSCKLIVFLSCLLNCQMQGSRICMLFSLRPQMDCVVPVEQSIQMTHWLIYFNKACCTDTNCWHLYYFPSLSLILSASLIFSGQKKSPQKSASRSFPLISGLGPVFFFLI